MRLRFFIASAFAIACAFVFSSCASQGPCKFNSECAVGYYCSQTKGRCVRNCQDSTRDCEPGEICDVNGQCRSTSGDGGGPDVVGQDVVTGDTSTQDVVADTAVDTGSDASQATKNELDACAMDAECKNSMLCRAFYKG